MQANSRPTYEYRKTDFITQDDLLKQTKLSNYSGTTTSICTIIKADELDSLKKFYILSENVIIHE